MSVRVLSGDDVHAHLHPGPCAAAMERVLAELARGTLHQPLRFVVRPPDAAGLMGLMPAYRGGSDPLYGLKAVCIFPDNPRRGLDAHQGGVLLYDGETGQLRALVDGSAITAVRTAAVSVVATKALARPDAAELAILGAGVQAEAHLNALAEALPGLRRVRVHSRSAANAEKLCRRAAARFAFSVEPAASVADALRGADVVVTATTAREPIVEREHLEPGMHLNVVGSSIPTTRELSGAAIAATRLFVDRRESTVNEAGDYLFALREGAIGEDHIAAELGEVLIGSAEGRRSGDEITAFKSLGLAVEDLAAAELVVREAEAAGAGAEVPW
jgi:ornithine cyclodeaminase/alanine dehydrogenase-like protein (mu-crystallin family)